MTWTLLHDRMADRASAVSLRQRWMTILVAKLDQVAHEGIRAMEFFGSTSDRLTVA
jgi:hypothetical protein